MAETRGINVVAHDLERIADVAPQFDAIASCDVIEHVSSPFEFVRTPEGRVGWIRVNGRIARRDLPA